MVLTDGCGEADLVLGVIPMNARRAGVIACQRGAVMRLADRNERPAAEHAHAADRFAHEIIGILTVSAMRSRRLMGNPLGRPIHARTIPTAQYAILCPSRMTLYVVS